MTFNAFEGARGPVQYQNAKTLVLDNEIDVLCLQEANGWHEGPESRLEDFAKSTGLTEVAFGDSNTDSKLAIFSRYPILGYIVHKEGFFHCAIQAWIAINGGVAEFIDYHGNPYSEEARLEEIERLRRHIGEDALLHTDLNSFSDADDIPDSLTAELRRIGNIIKYGDHETGLHFDVDHRLAEHGFTDMAVHHKTNVPTFPAMKGLEEFQHPSRFDRIMARGRAVKAVKDVQVITHPLTLETSDHNPVVGDVDESEFCTPVLPLATVEPLRPMRVNLLAA